VRTLFGPSLVKELETGTSLSTFQRHVQITVRTEIEKRLARLARV
jgi:hypothetical protein